MAYVIYQKGFVVYGFGETLDAALNDARQYTDIEDAPVEDWEGNHGDIVFSEISADHLKTLQDSDDPAECFCFEED